MKALEQRTKESRQEMDILDALEEIKDANARSAKMDVEEVLATKAKNAAALRQAAAERLKAEEDAAVAAAFGASRGASGKRVRRLADTPEQDGEGAAIKAAPSGADVFGGSTAAPAAAKRAKVKPGASSSTPSVGSLRADRLGLVKRKPAGGAAAAASATKPAAAAAAKPQAPAGLSGLADYGSDSD